MRSGKKEILNSSDRITSLNITLGDITCPITHDIFFHPVSAVPCGHAFEKSITGRIKNNICPCCRQPIESKFADALDKRAMVDKALTKRHDLLTEVYFDLNHYAELVKKNELNTNDGLRFTKILDYIERHFDEFKKRPDITKIYTDAKEILAKKQTEVKPESEVALFFAPLFQFFDSVFMGDSESSEEEPAPQARR